MCGSEAEVFASGASECYGYAWQSYGVECKDEFYEKCDMQVSIEADFSHLDIHDEIVVELWNKIASFKK
jgi:hypothetical protein